MNPDDLRVIKTQRLLEDTVVILLKKESFRDITTQQICQTALIGRSTFYRHFQDKYALLEFMVDELAMKFEDFVQQRVQQRDITTLLTGFAEKFSAQERLKIQCLFKVHETGADLTQRIENILLTAARTKLDSLNLRAAVSKDYVAELYVVNAMAFFRWTIQHGPDEAAVKLMNQIQANILY